MKGADRAQRKKGIFFVKQGVDSSNCRLNALNMFFQREKLSRTAFEQRAAEFDRLFGTSGSRDFTSFARGAKGDELVCVVSFVVAAEGKYRCVTRLAGGDDEEGEEEEEEEKKKEDAQEQREPEEQELEAVFVFDREHMWLERRIEGRWYVLDSRSDGPRQIKRPACDANNGYIFVFRQLRSEQQQREEKEAKQARKRRPKNASAAAAVVAKPKRQEDPQEL